MFQFSNPNYLYGLFIIPLLFIIYLMTWYKQKKALKKFGDLPLIKGLMPEASNIRPWIKFLIAEMALMLILIGLAGPKFGTKLQEMKREGIELVIALDISNSMLAEDIQPNRLENAKRAISKLTDRLRNDKIALIVFAGDAFVQLPMTTDYAATKMFLQTINPKLISNQGTAIGTAISLGMKSFTPSDDKNKALIIITDGENHEENALEMAKEATKEGIIIHTIGMGLAKGAPIPSYNAYGQKDYRTNREGTVVISKLDETMLKKIAAAGNGKYIRANNTKSGLNALFDELEGMDKVAMDTKVYSEYEEQFQYFIGFGIFLLLVDFLILQKKNKRLGNIQFFNNNLLGKTTRKQ